MATCASLVGSATLKDLAPSEKAKVTQLMHKIVEQGQQLQALREQCLQEVDLPLLQRRLLQEAEAIKQDLQEQNADVARDNTSLRAKLTHAFDLLKTYQHKVRVLHATLQSGQATAGGQCEASLAAINIGCRTRIGSGPPASKARGNHVGSLSPIKEGSSEGDSPASDACYTSRGHHTWAADEHSMPSDFRPASQAQPCYPILSSGCEDEAGRQQGQQNISQQQGAGQPHSQHSQLEPLALLARALLEAQSELFSNWRHSQQQQRGQQEPRNGATACGHGECSVGNVGDRETSGESGTTTSCSKENLSGNDGQQFIISCSLSPGLSRCKDATAVNDSLPCWHPEEHSPRMLQPSNAHHHAQALVPSSGALGNKKRQVQQQQQHCGAVAPYAFDTSLFDIVEDVEGLLAPPTGVQHQKLAFSNACCLNGTLLPQISNGGQQAWSSTPRWEAYEETDLLSLIADLE